jgi:hypothetical protein
MIHFGKLKKLWNERGFEIVLGLCVAVIITVSLYRKITGKKGSWSSNYSYVKSTSNDTSSRAPPRESKGEIECRRVLENLFDKSFDKARPDFLNNPVTGGKHNLELDCFNPELRLACEYNGVQHYKFVPYFHKNKEAFRNQQYRDYMKSVMCKENSITLISVPHTVDIGSIRSFLIKELQKHRFIV